jgi:hypothetical protein
LFERFQASDKDRVSNMKNNQFRCGTTLLNIVSAPDRFELSELLRLILVIPCMYVPECGGSLAETSSYSSSTKITGNLVLITSDLNSAHHYGYILHRVYLV